MRICNNRQTYTAILMEFEVPNSGYGNNFFSHADHFFLLFEVNEMCKARKERFRLSAASRLGDTGVIKSAEFPKRKKNSAARCENRGYVAEEQN
ncbi:unnamed protein product, partial [Nesidiocoris tenuis]